MHSGHRLGAGTGSQKEKFHKRAPFIYCYCFKYGDVLACAVATNNFDLSDKELKKNYRDHGWHDGAAMTRTQLVYSGKAAGVFKNLSSKLAKDKMTTYLFTKAPAAVYSMNGLVQNSFYTTSRQGSIRDGKVDFKQDGEILLISKNNDFADVRLNGQTADTRVVDVCRTAGLVVKVPAGKHTLTWKNVPKAQAVKTAPPPPR